MAAPDLTWCVLSGHPRQTSPLPAFYNLGGIRTYIKDAYILKTKTLLAHISGKACDKHAVETSSKPVAEGCLRTGNVLPRPAAVARLSETTYAIADIPI